MKHFLLNDSTENINEAEDLVSQINILNLKKLSWLIKTQKAE